MGRLLDIVTPLHKSTKRDYVARMVDDKVTCMRNILEELSESETAVKSFRGNYFFFVQTQQSANVKEKCILCIHFV